MERIGLFGVAVGFFAIGFVMVIYELSRIKAGRPLAKNSEGPIQMYHMAYLTMFVLAATTAIKAVIG